MLFCAQLYDCSVQDIISGSVNRIVNNYTFNLVEDRQLQTASLVRKLLLIGENALDLSNNIIFSRLELDQLVEAVSTTC